MATKHDKANLLLSSGAVTPYRLRVEGERTTGVRAHVKGEHGTYDVAAWYDSKGRIRYSCGCEYTDYHEVSPECSHAIAVGRLLT